jgi:hypothetical protein
MANVLPHDKKQLRACLLCSLVKVCWIVYCSNRSCLGGLSFRICVECVTIQRIRLRKLWRYHANARKRGTCSRVYERKFRRVSSVLIRFQQVHVRLTLHLSSVIAMMRPDESWVGKWQRIGKHPCFVGDSIGKEAKASIWTMQINLHEEYTPFEYLVGYQMM